MNKMNSQMKKIKELKEMIRKVMITWTIKQRASICNRENKKKRKRLEES